MREPDRNAVLADTGRNRLAVRGKHLYSRLLAETKLNTEVTNLHDMAYKQETPCPAKFAPVYLIWKKTMMIA